MPSSSPARRRNSTDVAVAKEAAHLERLRLARIEARDERLALQRKMGAVGGRPVRRLPGSHGGEAEEILSPHLRGGGGGRPGLGRDNVVENARRKKEDANRAHLERLKQARIDAHQERMALQLRMKGMAGRPGGGARPGGGGDHGGGQGDLLRQQAAERSSGVEQAVVKNDDSAYLEQLRLARVEAFEKRKALALRHEGARGERGGSGAGLVPGRRHDQGQQQTELPLRSGSTSEQVLRAKSQRKAEEQARHERMLLEARKAAFAERQALEAKMRNGGTTPRR